MEGRVISQKSVSNRFFFIKLQLGADYGAGCQPQAYSLTKTHPHTGS
jgi:hypothetical protein